MKLERTLLFSSNDPQEAFEEFRKHRSKRDGKDVAFADVRHMIDPPKTKNRYVVMRLVFKD